MFNEHVHCIRFLNVLLYASSHLSPSNDPVSQAREVSPRKVKELAQECRQQTALLELALKLSGSEPSSLSLALLSHPNGLEGRKVKVSY